MQRTTRRLSACSATTLIHLAALGQGPRQGCAGYAPGYHPSVRLKTLSPVWKALRRFLPRERSSLPRLVSDQLGLGLGFGQTLTLTLT